MLNRNLLRIGLGGKFIVDLSNFKQYFKEIETKFYTDKNTIKEKQDSILNVDFDEFNELYNEYYNIELHHIDIHRKSCLVTLYSYLESFLNHLCGCLHKLNSYQVEYTDLEGKGITRARLYLDKIVGVDFNKINSEWASIKNLNLIRNSIVHNSGKSDREKIDRIIKNEPNLSLNMFNEIRIKDDYINETINQIEAFLTSIHEQVFEK
ncbi:hypothetical protein ACFPZK_02440 [Psychrobacter urativorans]|uniref:hypothetical protein n=1 Tax=Psychrobacter urativorans TaxID=45610 RepID=UPI0019199B98|nr:hypothetical protein [Psychrobacter urativorans]